MGVLAITLSLAFLLVPSVQAKSKEQMPDEVLKAHTIKVVIFTDVREKLPDPKSEQAIRDAVEGALAKWGRFNLVEGESRPSDCGARRACAAPKAQHSVYQPERPLGSE